MKRLLAFVIALCLLMPLATAEDVPSMSDADLKALYKSVKQELMDRKLWDASILPAGVYQAGLNLPEGVYECISSEDKNAVYIYASYDDFLKDDFFEYFYPNEGNAFVIVLKGEVCYYVKKPCTVRPFVGLDW